MKSWQKIAFVVFLIILVMMAVMGMEVWKDSKKLTNAVRKSEFLTKKLNSQTTKKSNLNFLSEKQRLLNFLNKKNKFIVRDTIIENYQIKDAKYRKTIIVQVDNQKIFTDYTTCKYRLKNNSETEKVITDFLKEIMVEKKIDKISWFTFEKKIVYLLPDYGLKIICSYSVLKLI